MKTFFQNIRTRIILCCALSVGLFFSACEEKLKIPLPRQFKLMFLNDGSGSMNTPERMALRSVEFHTLLERLQESGGELGFGSITADSDQPIRRIVFLKPDKEKPIRKETANPYLQQIFDNEFEEEEINWGEQFGEFLNKGLGILDVILNDVQNQPPAKKTDVYSALSRSGIFLCEPSFVNEMGRYLITNSDLEDNVGASFIEFTCQVDVLVVNGAKNTQLLDELNIPYLRFESISSATQFILDKEEQWIQQFLVYEKSKHPHYEVSI